MLLQRAIQRVEGRLRRALERAGEDSSALGRTEQAPMEKAGDEPPVIGRLVVEIRSDGRRTIARGAIEDVREGARAALEAEGSTPLQLANSLARALLSLPLLARQSSRRDLEE